jgi:two-component system, NarL family, sensor kinase
MQLRYKVVLLAVVPLVLAAGLLAFLVREQSLALAKSQIDGIEEVLARDELLHLMNLARKAIPELDSTEHADAETRMRVLEKLRSLDFGKNGYFYVYDLNGTNLMHPWWHALEHRNQWNLTDDQGHPIIQQLIVAALEGGSGGGFLRYRWPHSSQPNQWSDKLGYVVCLPHWGWMLGTGIYRDDITAIRNITKEIQESSTAAIARTTRLIALIAVLVVLVVAALGVALNVSQQHLADAKLRKLTWMVVAAEEQERARVSRYLHDEAMQDLIAVKLVLETVLVELRRDSSHDRLVAMLDRGLAGLTEGVHQIRRVSHGLRPRLQSDGLPELLEQTGAAFCERTGLPTIVEAKAVLQPMSAEAATALFRVTQQALDNVNRHARATRVTIRLAAHRRWGSPGTSLTVSDNGRGFDVAAVERRPGGGIGLLNIRERIDALGGRLLVRSSPKGTEVEAFLPNETFTEGGQHDEIGSGSGDDAG